MDICAPEDISPPATPPNFNFSSSSSSQSTPLPSQSSRRSQRLRTSFTESTNNEYTFDEEQLSHLRQLKQSFQQLTPQQKQFLLYEIINSCDNSQLTYLNNLIAPRLKIDFLKELPIEISLHVLTFIDDPKTLARAATVSTLWNSLLKDEATWKSLCMKHQYRRRNSSICGGELLEPPSQRRNFSYREYFKRKYNIAAAWAHGGKVKHDPERILVTGGCDRDVRVWNLNTGELRHTLRGHNSTVRCLRMKDKRIAVTGSRDTTMRVWDIQRGALLHVLLGHQASVRCMEISGNIVVSGSYDSTARVWDLRTGRCLHVLAGHYTQIYAIAFDGHKVVTGSLDSNIRVWSAETGQCLATLHGHTSLVGQLQLSGSTLVSGGSDGCLRVWDLQHYECIQQISAHDNSVTCLQFDDRRMVSAGNDGRIKLWDIKQGRLIRNFTLPAKTVWKIQFSDTKAVVLMQRKRSANSEEGKTVMEVHDFDIGEIEDYSPESVDMLIDT
ncbi:hypothetical protein INT47_004394 [Mucor saturninus]|uniref:F-box domain-containing protein n=1 Tax=Mucor saturninus TaxID=64648 RepID=A0A8H7R0W8_9FUNG|nr:hypothetical protein INT47_004394 [Mucor saturninus]